MPTAGRFVLEAYALPVSAVLTFSGDAVIATAAAVSRVGLQIGAHLAEHRVAAARSGIAALPVAPHLYARATVSVAALLAHEAAFPIAAPVFIAAREASVVVWAAELLRLDTGRTARTLLPGRDPGAG